MQALADFITSPAGKLYEAVCRQNGLDVGATFSDEIVAMNVRVAFASRGQDSLPQGDDLISKTRRMEQEMKGWG
jgi:hypothetical protein